MGKRFCQGRFVIGSVVLILLAAIGLPAGTAQAKECADIPKDKIAETLKKINIPPAEIMGIRKSPLNGICEIEVNSKGSAGIFYTDIAFNYLIFGTLVDTKSMVNLTAASVQKIEDQKRVDLSKITLNEGLTVGEKGAAKKVIVLTDPD